MSELKGLPEHWATVSLGQLNQRVTSSINPKDFPDESFEYYSIPDYQKNQRPSLTKGSEIDSQKLVLQPNTILFGKLNPRVEKVWQVLPSSGIRQIGSTEWLPILPPDTVDSRFVYYLTWSDYVMPKAKSLVSGSTPSRQRVDPSSFYKIKVPLPTLLEQISIARILSSVEKAIGLQEKIVQTTTELKQALMQKLFSEGLRGEPQKETEIGLVPESWKICTVGDVAMIQSGGTPSRENPGNWLGGTIPWVKTGEINYRTIVDTEEKITQHGLNNSSARIFPEGTLLMAMYGQGITRGRVGILGIEAATNQACAAIIPKQQEEVVTEYLYFYFQHSYKNLRRLGHGANQKNMNADLIRTFPIPLPNPKEQQALAITISSLERRIEQAWRKKRCLEDLMKTLLHGLMNSKIQALELVTTK